LIQRGYYLKRLDFKVLDYGALHKYFGELANYDQSTLVLHPAAQ
jgi:hypothetical protein